MNLVRELKRRNVIRVAMAYLVLGWLLLQVGDVLFGLLELPGWSLRLLAALIALGLIPALVFAWAFELTPEGLRRESDVDRDGPAPPRSGRKLDVATFALLALALGLFVTQERWRPALVPGGAMSAGLDQSAEDAGEAARGAALRAGNAVSPEETSVAVLPFENMSPDPDNAYFAEGISEEILNLLADVDALSVASRTSAFVFQGRDTPIPDIAAALNVRYVLEGSVRKAGETVRITAQLIDAQTDRHLWSDTFDRTLDDIFAVQDEIASAIGDALQVELLGRGGERVTAETVDPDVYADYLQARHLLRQRTPESLRAGNELLIRVVEAAPDFARGHAALAEAYLLNRNLGNQNTAPLVAPEVAASQARMHASMARSLDPTIGGVDLILGSLAEDGPDLVTALAHYDRAIELEPGEPRPWHWRSMLLGSVGYLAEAVADARRARALDPQNPNVWVNLTATLLSAGDLVGAAAAVDGAIELGRGHQFKVEIALRQGDDALALETLAAMPPWDPDRPASAMVRAVQESLRSGEPVDLREMPPGGGPFWFYYASTEQRLAWIDGMDRWRGVSMAGLWNDRYIEMRRDPRFIALLDREGVLDLWRERGPPPDCRAEGDTFRCGFGSAADG
ncbi:MAG: hypothetical protein P8008_01730 [Gammaproteobacteria bacterium]